MYFSGFLRLAIALCCWQSLLRFASSQSFCTSLSTSSVSLPFTDVVVFGASYVDNGWHSATFISATSVLSTQDPNGLAQATGRASNGPLFPEVLVAGNTLQANYLNAAGPGNCIGNLMSASTLHEFAFSGATCDNTIFNMPATQAPLSVVQQVAQQLAGGGLKALNQATTLYIFLPATQDMSGQGNTASNTTVSQLLSNCYQNQIQALVSGVGATYFLLGNMYPFDLAPQNANLSPQQKAVVATNVANFNALLANVSAAFAQQRGVHVLPFDMHGLYVNQLIAAPATYYGNAANVNSACSANGAANAACSASVDSYLWWDVHHPTRATHRYIAQAMFATLVQSSGLAQFNSSTTLTTVAPTNKPANSAAMHVQHQFTVYFVAALLSFLILKHV